MTETSWASRRPGTSGRHQKDRPATRNLEYAWPVLRNDKARPRRALSASTIGLHREIEADLATAVGTGSELPLLHRLDGGALEGPGRLGVDDRHAGHLAAGDGVFHLDEATGAGTCGLGRIHRLYALDRLEFGMGW